MRIIRDALSIPLASYNNASSLYHRFHKVFGTTTIDGIEVFNNTRVFWANGSYDQSETLKRFTKALGLKWSDFIANRIDGGEIERVFWLTKTNYKWNGKTAHDSIDYDPDDPSYIPSLSDIADKLNSVFVKGDILNITISYGGATKRYIPSHKLEWTANGTSIVQNAFDTVGLRKVLHASPWFYFANIDTYGTGEGTIPFQTINQGTNDIPLVRYNAGGVSQTTVIAPCCDVAISKKALGFSEDYGDDPISGLGIFALMGDTRVFEPVVDINGNLVVTNEAISTVSTTLEEGEVLEYRYTVQYVYNIATPDSTIVTQLHDYYIREKDNDRLLAIDTKAKKALAELANDTEYVGSLYYKGHLRYDAASLMKRSDFRDMIRENLSIDQTAKKASRWERVLSVVIVVISIVVSVVVFYATLGAGTGISATIIAAGSAAASGAVALQVGMVVLSHFGGLSAAGLASRIGKLAEYTGYFAAACGVYAIIQSAVVNAWGEAAKQATAKAGKEATTTQIAKQYISNAVDEAISSAFKTFTQPTLTSTLSAINNGIKIATTVLDMHQDKELRELRAEYDEYEKIQEKNQSNVLKDPAGALYKVQTEICMYDAIAILDMDMDNKTGLGTFNQWYAERASI